MRFDRTTMVMRRLMSDGRSRPVRIGVHAAQRWMDAGGPQLGAAIAFHTMFALAPLLVVAIAVAGAVFGADAARGHVVGQIQGLVGPAAAHGIESMIQSAWRSPHGIVAATLGVVALLMGASGVFSSLRRALNGITGVEASSSGISALLRARLIAFALVLGFGFLAIVSLLLSAVLAAVGAFLADVYAGLAPLIALLDVAVSTVVIAVAFAALLRWLPDVPPSRRAVWAGAFCSALLFAIGKHLIGLYLARASVASSYGAAGSFVIVMLWVYYSAQILLYGAALAAVLDAGDDGASPRHDHAPSARHAASPPTSLADARARRAWSAAPAAPQPRAPVKILRFPSRHMRRVKRHPASTL
jgi:membrane protein